MRLGFQQFIIAIFSVSLTFIFSVYLALKQGWIRSVPSFTSEITLSLAIVTTAISYYLQRIKKSKPQEAFQSYLFSIVVKMVIGCAIILSIIMADRAGAMANALLFIVVYFIFTCMEIFFLSKGR
ncbi:MAG: hypothetical protein AABY93_04130 [Bacteroidota bacterium]